MLTRLWTNCSQPYSNKKRIFQKKDTTTVCTKEDAHAFSAVQAVVVIVFL